MSGGTAGEHPLVFLSYSHKDAKWRDRLLVMLAPVLERELEVWSDQREVVGEEWRPQLEKAISPARAALLRCCWSAPISWRRHSAFIMK
ncbi:MAG: TIR domain-containing protein [Solirubrobacteraceae bacterium]